VAEPALWTLTHDDLDVVHADQLWMAQYALRCRGVRRVLSI
jgi:hypothetical protein